MVIVTVTDFLAFVLMHTQKNESQEYQIFGMKISRKMTVCVYTFLYVEKILDPAFDAISAKKKLELINKICKERISFLKNEQNEVSKEQTEKKEELKIKIEVIENLYDKLKKIEDEIIEIRNILSHTKESEGNTLKSQINKKKTAIVVDDKWCIDTRKNMLKHSDNLDEIIKHI